jgi:hypothetical protein
MFRLLPNSGRLTRAAIGRFLLPQLALWTWAFPERLLPISRCGEPHRRVTVSC